MTSLIIAAHPDDEILGCGGLIAKHSDSQEFITLILTDGASGRYDEVAKIKLSESAHSANQIIGTKNIYFENLPNQGLDNISLSQVIDKIEYYIDFIKPDTIFTHSSADLNKDHRIVYDATMTAARPLPGQEVKKIYSYFVASSSEWNRDSKSFTPNTYVDIKDTLTSKIEAMKCYLSECRPYPHPRSAEAIKIYSSFWGISSGLEFAEPFRLIYNISGII